MLGYLLFQEHVLSGERHCLRSPRRYEALVWGAVPTSVQFLVPSMSGEINLRFQFAVSGNDGLTAN